MSSPFRAGLEKGFRMFDDFDSTVQCDEGRDLDSIAEDLAADAAEMFGDGPEPDEYDGDGDEDWPANVFEDDPFSEHEGGEVRYDEDLWNEQ